MDYQTIAAWTRENQQWLNDRGQEMNGYEISGETLEIFRERLERQGLTLMQTLADVQQYCDARIARRIV